MNKKIIIISASFAVIVLGIALIGIITGERAKRIEREAERNATNAIETVFSIENYDDYSKNINEIKNLLSPDLYKERTKSSTTEQIKKLEAEYGYRLEIEIKKIELIKEEGGNYLYKIEATETTYYDKYNESYSLTLEYEAEIQYLDGSYTVTRLVRLSDAG